MSRPAPLFQSAAIQTADTLPQPDGPDFNLYSPAVFDGTLYLGGWLRAADIGADKLYQTQIGVDAPRPLNWSSAPPPNLAVNDPTVVRLTDNILEMYVTVLDQAYATTADMCDHNIVGMARSEDNGATWDWKGIVIGQHNGLSASGAWSPSALVQGSTVSVWYHTGAHDVDTGAYTSAQVLRSQFDITGPYETTKLCTRTDTGAPLLAMNVSISQSADGTYWLVANDFGSADAYDLVAYTSRDGLAWTPWATTGPTLVHAAGAMLLTPTILSVDSTRITLLYAEDLGGHTVEHEVTLGLNDTTPAHFLVQDVFGGQGAEALAVTGNDYTGPVSGLEHEYIQITPDNLNLVALSDNCFLHSGNGMDALVAHAGYNVLDGGGGSNFLTGGSGTDSFFIDDRGSSASIWSTVVGFHAGDAATVWGVTPQDFGLAWVDGQGAAGCTGLTLHATASGRPAASVTLAGYSQADMSSGRLSISFGADPASGSAYMYVHGKS